MRWADGDVHPVDGRIALVRETHPVGSRGAIDVVNEIVVLDSAGQQDTVVSGPDFVSDPRWSPGRRLPGMAGVEPPGDAVGCLDAQGPDAMGVVTVAGGVDEPAEGICQLRWAPDGSLWFCSDREDWWSLYRWTPEAGVERMFHRPGDVGEPKWIFGTMRYAFLADGRVVLAVLHEGNDSLCLLEPDGSLIDLPARLHLCQDMDASGDAVVLMGSSPLEEPAVLRLRQVGAMGPVTRVERPARARPGARATLLDARTHRVPGR